MAPHDASDELTLGQCATLAIVMEVTAPKPGNVHRGADFEDVTYPDFIVAATAIGPVFDRAAESSVGQTVLAAVEATRRLVGSNTNLGTILLLAPLAKVPRGADWQQGITDVLSHLNWADARDVYAAIRLAQPGGLGKVAVADIADAAPQDLLAAMRLAADRDLVARQYADNFADVLTVVVPALESSLATGLSIGQSIVRTHLTLMSQFPDSLIARKCGKATAERSAHLAGQVLAAGQPGDDAYEFALGELDFWLRSDHHQRNPGTSADLIAAGLFVTLRDGIIKPPLRLA